MMDMRSVEGSTCLAMLGVTSFLSSLLVLETLSTSSLSAASLKADIYSTSQHIII
jgi:hypothetical protein